MSSGNAVACADKTVPIFTTTTLYRRHGGVRRKRQVVMTLLLFPSLAGRTGPPPMKWSDSRYGFATEEDWNGEEAQTGRDRCEVAAGLCPDVPGDADRGCDPDDWCDGGDVLSLAQRVRRSEV